MCAVAPLVRRAASPSRRSPPQLAFLVTEGRVAIAAADGAAFVQVGKPPETSDFEAGLIKHQNIIALDFHTYQALVKRWCKGPPMLDRDLKAADAGQRAAKAARVS